MNEWLVLFKNVDTKPFLECTKFMEHNEVDIKDRSTKGENSIQFNFVGQEASAYSPDSAMSKLSNLFIKYIKKINEINHNIKVADVTGAWQVEGGKGSYHRLHNHTLNRKESLHSDGLSCVLYLDVPDDEDRGEFYFLIRKDNVTKSNSIQPDKGDLIIMPKSVYHGVYPQTSDGLRRTLNIDFNIYEQNN